MKQLDMVEDGLKIVVAITIIGLMVALLLAPVLGDLNAPTSQTYDQSQGETVYPDRFGAALNDVNSTTGNINVTLQDNATGQSQTFTLSEGQNKTVTLDGKDVTTYNQNVTSATTAQIKYEYPSDYGWGMGARALYGILDLVIILVVFLTAIGFAVASFKGS